MTENNDYYKTISNILKISDKIKVTGSFKLYHDYNRVCDVDLNESISFTTNDDFLSTFKSYIIRVRKMMKEETVKNDGKKAIYLVKAYFNIPYLPLQKISNKMGYVDGNMIKHNNNSILDDVNNLPDELKHNINILLQKYEETKDINDYFNIFAYINNNLYANWTLNELKNGIKQYYEQNIDIGEYLNNQKKFTYFYIEVIYKKIRFSNYINIYVNRDAIIPKEYYISAKCDEMILGSELSLYRLLKKFKMLINWLLYTHKIKKNNQRNKTKELYKEIEIFIKDVAIKYNKFCSIKNKIDIINIRLKKYKKIDSPNTEKIDKCNAFLKKYNDKYINGIAELEKKYKHKYLYFLKNKMYTFYLTKFFKIN